jgi:hypothetical protein
VLRRTITELPSSSLLGREESLEVVDLAQLEVSLCGVEAFSAFRRGRRFAAASSRHHPCAAHCLALGVVETE